MTHFIKSALRDELKQVNKYIDERIKSRKPYKELERVRKELLTSLKNA